MSLLWVALLLTLFYQGETVRVSLLWNAAGIAGIAAVVFGVMYNALWNHLTLKPFWNIAISSTLNLIGSMAAVWLFSKEMFELIAPWFPGMWLFSIVLHVIGFYFYVRIWRQNWYVAIVVYTVLSFFACKKKEARAIGSRFKTLKRRYRNWKKKRTTLFPLLLSLK